METMTTPQERMEAYLQEVVSQNENCATTSQFVSCRASSESPASMRISISDEFGRAVTAARDISAGEVLFCETPLVLAPQAGAGPTCLRCLKNLTKSPRRACEKCGAPMCLENASCQNKYHSDQECSILERLEENEWSTKIIPFVNAALTPLRTWINIQEKKAILPIVMTLQSNAELRQKMPIGKFIDTSLMPLLQTRLKLAIPREFVHHVSGIFDTNAFRVNTAGGEDCRALVPLAGMMMHDCTPNTDHWFVDGRCLVRASCFIPKGADITNNYTNCTLGTQSRQKHLSFTKHFQCSCKRCKDPTELETHVSSVKCRVCKVGLVVPPSSDSDSQDWQCGECQAKLPSEMANTITRACSYIAEFKNSEDTMSRLEDLTRLVGLQHYGTLQLLTALTRTLMAPKDEDLTEEQAWDLVTATEHILPTADILAPGLSLFRGELLLGNLRGRAVLQVRGNELKQSELLPSVTPPPNSAQLVEERLTLCEAIHKDHSIRAAVSSLRRTFKSLGLVPSSGRPEHGEVANGAETFSVPAVFAAPEVPSVSAVPACNGQMNGVAGPCSNGV